MREDIPSNAKQSSNKKLLPEVLKEKITEAGISVHALEKQAGLKRSAVQNILQGRSKKPSAEILYMIAKILGCNLNDLLGEPTPQTENMKGNDKTMELDITPIEKETFNVELYAEALQTARDLFSTLNTIPDKRKALEYMNELYQYSIENGLTTIDKNFAEWLAKRWL